jgi:hypothetical protein
MLRLSRWCAVALLAFVPLSASAQTVWTPVIVTSAPSVAYYTPAPTVSYFAPAPVVSYSVPVTTYYAPVPVTTFYAPVVPAPVSVSTYRYGLFGRRSVTTVNYGAPVVTYSSPVVFTPRRVTYFYP